MRITTGMFYSDLVQNIQQNMGPMLTSQEELSTGYKMNKPSDDPGDLGTVMSLSHILDQNNSEVTALTTQQSRLGESDSALGQATKILNRAYTLLEEANNTDMTSSDTGDIAQEVKQLLLEMVDTANQTRGTGPGETFFTLSGTTVSNSGSPTVSGDTLSYDTVDPNAIFWDSSVTSGGPSYAYTNTKSTTSTSSNYTDPNVFQVLVNAYNDLENNTNDQNVSNGTFTEDIGQLQDAVNWITAQRAQVGAVEDRLSSLQTQLASQNLSMTSLMANFKDTDVETATVKFSEEQSTYQAALETSAKVMQVSLTNYMLL